MQHDATTRTTAPAPLNWRHRKARNAARKQAAEQAAARRPQLVAGFVAELGGADRITPLKMEEIERVVDLLELAAEMRPQVRQAGGVRLRELMSLEGLIMRSIKALGLPSPAARRPGRPMQRLTDYLAGDGGG